MGVVNVTPDSFSDGGAWLDPDAAIAHGLELAGAGAAIIDVGGESTRPGAARVDVATERGRVVPVIEALAASGVTCSVDTTRAEVAAAAIDAGAAIVNDVSGGLGDPEMAAVVADTAVPWVLMHWRGPSDVMNSLAVYRDVVSDVRDELIVRVEAALATGVDRRSLIIDPGLGFAKNADHNWAILRHLDSLTRLGLPVLIGASRKRFLGELLADPDGTPRPADGREIATAAVSMLTAQRGLWGVRVHEVAATRDAFRVLRYGDPTAGMRVAGGDRAHTSPLCDLARSAPMPDAGVGIPGRARDHITLTGLTVRGHHGVFADEKRDGQDFVIDMTVWRDVAGAAATDDLDRTVNYAELAEAAARIVAGPPRDLIETVATEIAETVVSRWDIDAAEVTVHKPHAPIPRQFADVAVTVRRGRRPAVPPAELSPQPVPPARGSEVGGPR